VVEPDRSLKDAKKLGRKSRPAPAQDLVVGVLNPYAGEAPKQIEGVEQFLDIEKTYFPRMRLLAECASHRFRCVSVAAAGMVIDDGQSSHAWLSAEV
jgi:hypothetical protein